MTTFLPARARYAPAISPLWPAPMMIASYVLTDIALLLLPGRIVERQLHDFRRCLLAMVFHGDLDGEFSARLEVRALHVGERDVLLQHRRPGAGRRVADLLAVDHHGQTAAHSHTRDLRWQAD